MGGLEGRGGLKGRIHLYFRQRKRAEAISLYSYITSREPLGEDDLIKSSNISEIPQPTTCSQGSREGEWGWLGIVSKEHDVVRGEELGKGRVGFGCVSSGSVDHDAW